MFVRGGNKCDFYYYSYSNAKIHNNSKNKMYEGAFEEK